MSRTIPRWLLPHTVTLEPATPTAEGLTYGPAIPLRARVERRTKLVYYQDGKTASATALAFLPPRSVLPDPDPEAALPLLTPIEPQVDDRITYAGHKYRALEITTLVLIEGNPHHHEVWLG